MDVYGFETSQNLGLAKLEGKLLYMIWGSIAIIILSFLGSSVIPDREWDTFFRLEVNGRYYVLN